MVRGARGVTAVLALLLGSALLLAAPATASAAQARVVSEDPVNTTPNLLPDATVPHPAVYALDQQGPTVYVGGLFHGLQNAGRTASYRRANLAAFTASTGVVSRTFLPHLNGSVWAVQAAGGSIYVGGTFSTVDGAPRRGVAKLDASTGRLVPGFHAGSVQGDVSDLRIVRGRLLVGGAFRDHLAALDLASGAETGYLDLHIGGTAPGGVSSTEVYRFAVSPDQSRLVAIGSFATVSGQARARAFMVDLGAGQGTLAPWYYQPLASSCRRAAQMPAYLRGVDFSPDGSYFVLVATGGISQPGELGRSVCDAAARFETGIPHPDRPTWINYTGGDTLHSVAVTGAAVYVSGHQRWLDNAGGADHCVPGCAPRQGIGAIDPRTGRALPWNPGKTRGVGGRVLLATAGGLWVGSDGQRFHGEFRYGIAFAPLPGSG